MKKFFLNLFLLSIVSLISIPVTRFLYDSFESVLSYISPDAEEKFFEISDADMTEGDAFDSSLHIDSEGNAHIAWKENSNDPNEDIDMYYYNTIDGELKNITDRDRTIEDVTVEKNSIRQLIDSNGIYHVIWAETDELYPLDEMNIYYYNSGADETKIISDLDNSEGYARNVRTKLDAQENIHIIWQEEVAGESYNAFYYNSIIDDTLDISHASSTGDLNTNTYLTYFTLDTFGTMSHVVWTEYVDTNHGYDMFYFN